ncbi:efflux transporter outer membrane subunit [Desulfobulbus rhabdoformis]|uniref:efflux transporter outer membrane subunit n=1 Tax=Desulfobulbus rhabdoformis TaxID=34032 RepID=UPI0019627473|nr:efflux transporter outer membrane subunit [Desulfobulbus rhabdoformis]MBM9616682.1 efflux transporter outer membrane subunit [Desulfobulbus rhabdoformis]
MKKLSATIGLLTCTGLLLGGCGLKTPYTRPNLDLPKTWTQSSASLQEQSGRWWQRFDDPNLNQLIDAVLKRNADLAVAALQLNKARLRAQLAESDRLPGLSVDGSGQISRSLGSEKTENKTFSASGSVAYEIDLWNKLGRTADAARWEALATEQDRESTALSLVATTASLYWQIGYLNQRLVLSSESISYAQKTLQLVELQKEAGAATGLEILEAKRSLFSQEASHTQLVQQQVELRNALAILLAGPPENLQLQELTSLKDISLPGVNAGMPAELLSRRPDLRAAEARLRSTLATTDATRASYYPGISLSGSYGGSSEQLSRLLSNPVATLGASLALPFVEFRDMQRNIKISETEYQQAIIEFRQNLYTALSEVENTLSARKQYRLQAEKLTTTLEAAQQTEAIYELRYKAGATTLQTWLDAQENRRQAEINLAENLYNQLNNHAELVKALGGDLTL